jgi:hypothetical protein
VRGLVADPHRTLGDDAQVERRDSQEEIMPGSPKPRAARKLSKRRLGEMIAEACVDCYNDSEVKTGFYTMIDDHLAIPFVTTVFECEVEVVAVDMLVDDSIVAVCRRGTARQRIPILDLPLPTPLPAGSDWIEAYRAWSNGSG